MTVTFLEMKAKPQVLPPTAPKGKIAILKAEKPTVHFYRYLYETIGHDYYWVDRIKTDDASLAAIICHPQVELYVLHVNGCPAGMAELDFRNTRTGLIAYFGLMPEFIGKRLGYFFLYHAVANAWAKPIMTLLVNTCTLDHPRALALYQRIGFKAYSREDRSVELP
ncbi:MAG: GNAT family N-acetyltransferase [Alphaproteobacteria bacterium]|nr:GNAT family N-acetyltransferase [Alphaproteobacteria bacterium]MDE2492882.1 GNAT family N-acetyltransferase [Alphaproteobacteria bacterium]